MSKPERNNYGWDPLTLFQNYTKDELKIWDAEYFHVLDIEGCRQGDALRDALHYADFPEQAIKELKALENTVKPQGQMVQMEVFGGEL